MPGIITLDRHSDDWEHVGVFNFYLLPALDPHEDDGAYTAKTKMTIQTLHDGRNMFFLLDVDGDFVYSQGGTIQSASVALMSQVGDNASLAYYR